MMRWSSYQRSVGYNIFETMQKIVGCIKQKSLYKELRPVIKEIAKSNKASTQNAISAIHHILTSKESTPLHKLYAVRFAKDCFEQADPDFIQKAQKILLPQLHKIGKDKIHQQTIDKSINLVVNDYSNLLLITVECIKNWGAWLDKIGYGNRFLDVYKDLLKAGMRPPVVDKYFKDQTEAQFLQKLQKHIGQQKLPSTINQFSKPVPPPPSVVPKQALGQSKVAKIKQQVNKLFDQMNSIKVAQHPDDIPKKIQVFESKLEAISDQYMNQSVNFDQQLVNGWMVAFEQAKRRLKRIEYVAPKSDQQRMYENLPQQVVFTNESEQSLEEGMRISKKSMIPLTKGLLKSITQESQPQESQRNLHQLEQLVGTLDKSNKELNQKLKTLTNHHNLEEANAITKELMELRRAKFTLTEQLRKMEQKLKSQVFKPNALGASAANYSHASQSPPFLSMRPPQSSSLKVSMYQEDMHPHVRRMKQFVSVDNIHLLKMSILGAATFFKSNAVTIRQQRRLLLKQGHQVLNITLSLETKQPTKSLSTYYQNSSSFDIWKKQLSQQSDSLWTQQIAIKIQRIPLSLGLARVDSMEPQPQFFLPFLFINFLRQGQVSKQAFDSAFNQSSDYVVTTRAYRLDTMVVGDPEDILKYFENPIKVRTSGGLTVKAAYLYAPEDKVILLEIELMPGAKIQFRALEVESSNRQKLAKQLVQNCVFLFTN